MSADWFCKIDGKKHGPLNGQQLKTAVAKGQIKAEHLVRRGQEGPWLPAGKVKGLFPEGTAGPQQSSSTGKPPAGKALPPKAAALPTARSQAAQPAIPAAQAAQTPPSADVPDEFRLGGSHKHASMSVDQLNIEAEPLPIKQGNGKRRKGKSPMGLKKSEQQRVTTVLMGVIGVGMFIGVAALVYAVATGQLSSKEPEKKEDPVQQLASAAAAKKAEELKKEEEQKKADEGWTKIPNEWTAHGKVELRMPKVPLRQPPPEAAKLDAEKYPEVLVLPVELKLKDYVKEPVALAGWADAAFKSDVYCKDDEGHKFPLLAMVPGQGAAEPDLKQITSKPLKINLVFQSPGEKFKFLRLELQAMAFGESGMLDYQVNFDQVPASSVKKPAKLAKGKGNDAKSASSPSDTKKSEDKPAGEVKPSAKGDSKDDGDIGLSDPDANTPETKSPDVKKPDAKTKK
jgi:hypothetical protein